MILCNWWESEGTFFHENCKNWNVRKNIFFANGSSVWRLKSFATIVRFFFTILLSTEYYIEYYIELNIRVKRQKLKKS